MTMMIKVLTLALATAASSAATIIPKGRALGTVLATPRGGGGVLGTPITKDNIAAAFALQNALYGAVGAPAPEVLAKAYGTEIEGGTIDGVFSEFYGTTLVGLALLTYFSVFKKMDTQKAVMWAGVPCLVTSWKHAIKGTFNKLGFMNGFGTGMTSFMAACIYSMYTGKGDSEIAAKLFSSIPLLTGILGILSPGLVAMTYGIPEPEGKKSSRVFYWYHAILAWWGVFAMSLLYGKTPMQALTYCVAGKLITQLKSVFSDMILDGAGAPHGLALFDNLLSIAMTVGLLVSEGSGKSSGKTKKVAADTTKK